MEKAYYHDVKTFLSRKRTRTRTELTKQDLWSRSLRYVLRRSVRPDAPGLMRSVSDQRKVLGGCWDPILVFERESSAYVIQGVSATVRGQAKLFSEGEPQGAIRRPPNRLTRHKGRGTGRPEQMSAEKVCDALREAVIACQYLYNGSMCWKTDRAGQPRAGRSPYGPWPRVRPLPVWRGRGVCSSDTRQAGERAG